jgi:osmotically-inducible protein OsmY
MSTRGLTVTDLRMRDEVQTRLALDPDLDASAVGVSVQGGVVTLTGFIDTYAAKLAAERTAKLTRGVRVVANDLQVRLKLDRTDADIAHALVRSLNAGMLVPDTVQAVVHHHHVTLTGTVTWRSQRQAAEVSAKRIAGVRRVMNRIRIVPPPPGAIAARIEKIRAIACAV